MFVYLPAKINKTYQHEIQRILRKSETCARAGPVFINNTVFLIYIDIRNVTFQLGKMFRFIQKSFAPICGSTFAFTLYQYIFKGDKPESAVIEDILLNGLITR